MANRKTRVRNSYTEKKATKDMMKREAVKRLKYFGVLKNVHEDFKNDDILYYSEKLGRGFEGMLYWLHNNEKWYSKVKELEETYNITVYHVVYHKFAGMEILDCLYVGNDTGYWSIEWDYLKNGVVNIYGINLTIDSYSEFGTSEYKQVNGGLAKVWYKQVNGSLAKVW